MHKLTFVMMLLGSSLALADEPAPVPPPDPPKPEEPKPADPTPDKPADPPKPEPPKPESKGVNIPSNPTTTAPTGTTSTVPVFDHDGGVSSSHEPKRSNGPKIAVELSMTSGRLGDPFVVYKGYTLENGQAVGTRLEGNLMGISLSYELASLSNTQACSGDACFKGDFGRTTINVLSIGYRKRFNAGVVRPYVHLGLGGVLANIGDWSMTSSKTVKGGEARGAVGVEIPFLKKFFASAAVAYRFMVVENPLRNKDADNSDLIFVNRSDLPNGDYAEDAHLITGYLGIGMNL